MALDKKVFLDGQASPYDQGHVVVLTCLRHVEETLIPVTRPSVGGSMSCNDNDGHLPHELGNGHEWPLHLGSVGRSPSHVAHQLPGDAGRVSSIKANSPRPEKPLCACSHRQHTGDLINRQRSLHSCPLYRLAPQILLWAQDKL